MPRHGSPSDQSIDHSQTFYGTYTNRGGYHASGRGTINIHHQTTNSQSFEALRNHCSPSAAFDSAARYDPPRCTESTRLGITQIIEEWVDTDGDDVVPSSLFWLHGGAGVGKSAIAQSLSEKFKEKEQLAASFFFFRTDSSRNNGDYLIPTLVSHLACSFKGIIPFVEHRISENWDLFTKKYEIQIQELLIEPLLALKHNGGQSVPPRLIVIDGLDECRNPDVQSDLLRVIARAIPHIPYPLRFLVTSRPEAHILHVFNHHRDLQAITVHKYNLSDDPDADMDIRKFLENEFMEIRRVHRLGRHLPHTWPDRNAIASLVERSSGHFIYASTVIRYIRSPKHRPDDRLEVILRLRLPQEGDRPYAQLDALYALIFEGVEGHGQLKRICLVLGILYLKSRGFSFVSYFPHLYYITIDELLGLKAGDLVLLLDPILSLLSIDDEEVRIFHKSLFDYLLDFTRGGHLPFDLARVHESAAAYFLQQKVMKDLCYTHDFNTFAYHCQYAFLNDTLKNYLCSLEVPYPNSVAIIPEAFPHWDDGMNSFMRTIIWRLFRILSREVGVGATVLSIYITAFKDFEPTGQAFERYVAKWMRYLKSATPRPTPSQVGGSVVTANTLKCDTLLREWKPRNFNPMEVGIDPVRRLAYIEQEHNLFTTYVQASFSGGDTNFLFASSLVFGDDFIHSYNFVIRDEKPRTILILQTYSRHGNTCYQDVHYCSGVDVVRDTQSYLMKVEKYLSSDHYQKYGLAPVE